MVTQTIYGVRKRSFRPTPKAGEQPFAPTPLSHSVGEGLGEGNKRRKRERAGALYCPHPLCPPLPPAGEGERAAGRTAVRPYTPRPQRGRGLIPIAQPKFTKTSMPDNPLLKGPPASRGNRTHAPHAVPLAKRGEP